MSTYVHRIPPIDKSSPHILANISSKSNDTKTLDLEIEATEGVNVFYASLPSSSLASSLAKGSNLSSSQWRHILRILLLHDTSSSEDVDVSNIELVARLDTSASLTTSHSSADSNDTPTSATLRFRRNISGIHKTIADIVLPLDENHPIDTISWTATAVQQASTLQSELSKQIAKTSKAESQVESLKSQLDELLAAKKDHENELIARFALLLNEKKAKIRELQSQNGVTPFPRGQISPPAEEEPMLAIEAASSKGRGSRARGARGGRGRGKAAAPRGAKRKEPPKEEPEPEPEPAEESDVEMTKQDEDDEETTDDEGKIADTDEDRGKMDEGASTDMDGTTDDEDDVPAKPKQRAKAKSESASKSTETATNENGKGKGKAAVHTLPPRRELPFGNTVASEDKIDKNEAAKMDVDNASTTDDDDDEL